MSTGDQGNPTFPVPPYAEAFGIPEADLGLSTSRSVNGRKRLSGGLTRLVGQVHDVEVWWEQAEPVLAAEIHPEMRSEILKEFRSKVELLCGTLASLSSTVTTLAASDAQDSGDQEVRDLMEHALRWNRPWALRHELAAINAADPVDDPGGFLLELERRLRSL